ncbi:hypothetical protein Ami103574_04115 [Aminipila butyrica]|uniref:ABC-2 family transporter protein n=1 Tax=Aminipila butyrica TaxID=433296 RepID=A0A858BTZ3_9FIRM|nr:ABC transporter permease subunit [Aminipila butyrica]QIB68555.1 hypothetical protein Ami103574_04115 [Aminipila butyrica]
MKCVFRYEIKKILFTPAILSVVLLCLIFNMALIGIYDDDNPVQSDSQAVNIFEGFDAGDIAEGFIAKYHVTGSNADHIRGKYAKLQPIIDEKAVNGDSLSDYFRERTYSLHRLLFNTIFLAITAESSLLALFAALVSITYEQTQGTEYVVYSSKVGRHILRCKFCASLLAAICSTAMILVATLVVFFAKFDFSKVWGDNVSSSFNFAAYSYTIPFVTWHSFTVGEYLGVVISAAVVLASCFCLMGYTIGLFVPNSYGACIGALLAVVLPFLVKPLFSMGSISLSILNLMPTNLVLNSGQWFTDGNAGIIWANFETIGLVISFAVLGLTSGAAVRIFRKREFL